MVGNEEIKDDKISQESVEITNSKRKSKKQLPNTGMKDSMLGLLGFALLASLGLGYTRKYLRK
jgi:LPXTG-motif cell wall anchor domain protein